MSRDSHFTPALYDGKWKHNLAGGTRLPWKMRVRRPSHPAKAQGPRPSASREWREHTLIL
eukprot:1046717-Prymnesium_polylepis.1